MYLQILESGLRARLCGHHRSVSVVFMLCVRCSSATCMDIAVWSLAGYLAYHVCAKSPKAPPPAGPSSHAHVPSYPNPPPRLDIAHGQCLTSVGISQAKRFKQEKSIYILVLVDVLAIMACCPILYYIYQRCPYRSAACMRGASRSRWTIEWTSAP